MFIYSPEKWPGRVRQKARSARWMGIRRCAHLKCCLLLIVVVPAVCGPGRLAFESHSNSHSTALWCDKHLRMMTSSPPAAANPSAEMVSKRRYDSVERFAAMNLTERVQRPIVVQTGPVQQQQAPSYPHPFSMMRRRSNEQLLPTPSTLTHADSPQTMLRPHSVASPLTPHPPLYQPQYQQQRPPQQIWRSSMHQAQPTMGQMTPQKVASAFGSSRPASQPSVTALQTQPSRLSAARNDTELAENVRSFFAHKIPGPVWLSLSLLQIVAGIVSLFVGALNASPYNCMIEPNIPIYLIVSGVLLIVNGGIRLFFMMTSSSDKSKRMGARQQPQQQKTMLRHMSEFALEGVVLFAIVVVVILGCVWVYGAQRYMHSQGMYMSMFDRHYCERGLYWTAWWSVTLHLGVFALLILLTIAVLVWGAIGG